MKMPTLKILDVFKFDLANVRNFDIRDIPNWPLLPRLILLFFIGLLVVLLLFLIDGRKQLSMIRSLHGQEAKLVQEIKLHQAKIRYQDLYFAHYQKNKEALRKAIGEIPPVRDIEEIFAVLADIAKKNGVVIRDFNRGQLVRHDLYSEQLMDMAIAGSFYQLGHFVAEVAKLPYIIYFQEFILTPQDNYLQFKATASVLLQGGA